MQTFPGKCVKKCDFFLQMSEIFVRKRLKYPSKRYISPQNCKDFPPKAKFPKNQIPKFHILSMHVHVLKPDLTSAILCDETGLRLDLALNRNILALFLNTECHVFVWTCLRLV